MEYVTHIFSWNPNSPLLTFFSCIWCCGKIALEGGYFLSSWGHTNRRRLPFEKGDFLHPPYHTFHFNFPFPSFPFWRKTPSFAPPFHEVFRRASSTSERLCRLPPSVPTTETLFMIKFFILFSLSFILAFSQHQHLFNQPNPNQERTHFYPHRLISNSTPSSIPFCIRHKNFHDCQSFAPFLFPPYWEVICSFEHCSISSAIFWLRSSGGGVTFCVLFSADFAFCSFSPFRFCLVNPGWVFQSSNSSDPAWGEFCETTTPLKLTVLPRHSVSLLPFKRSLPSSSAVSLFLFQEYLSFDSFAFLMFTFFTTNHISPSPSHRSCPLLIRMWVL